VRSSKLILAGALFVATSATQASLVTWELRDVTFDDGGTANGFFTLDPTISFTRSFDFNVETTRGTTFPGLHYTNSNAGTSGFVGQDSCGDTPCSILTLSYPKTSAITTVLELFFNGALPPTGDSTGIRTDSAAKSAEFGLNSDGSIFMRSVTQGSVIGFLVPEPPAFIFVALGAVATFLLKGRKGLHAIATHFAMTPNHHLHPTCKQRRFAVLLASR